MTLTTYYTHTRYNLYIVTLMIMYTRDVRGTHAIALVINACLVQSFNANVILPPVFIIYLQINAFFVTSKQ